MVLSFSDYLFQTFPLAADWQTTPLSSPHPLQIVYDDDEQAKIDAIEFDGNWEERLSTASSLFSPGVDTDTGRDHLQEESDLFWEQLHLAATKLVRDVMQDDGDSKILKQRIAITNIDPDWTLIQLRTIYTHEGEERAVIRAHEILTRQERSP